MTKNEFMEGIHILQEAYNYKFTSDKLKIYYENLKDIEKEKYLKSIKKLIKTNSFIPSIAEILNKQEDVDLYKDIDWNSLYINLKNK